MTSQQQQAATKAAIENFTRLIETAPDWGECGLTLTIHAGDVKRISETRTETVQPGVQHG